MVAAVFIGLEATEFAKDAERARQEGFAAKKKLVKDEVEKVVDYIHFTRLFMERGMHKDLKLRTYEAWSVINHIYTENQATHSNQRILELIKQALRPIRFNNGRGYYFIVDLNGVEQMYPVRPEFEGENLLDLQDDRRNNVIQDEIDIVKAQGEGYVKGYWRKPDQDTSLTFAKTSFVKIFEPLNIYVGTGDYLMDVRKDIQEDVKQRILRSRYGEYGYVFVNTYNGIAVIIDSEKYKPGDNIWEVTDPKGVKVVQEEWKAVNRPGGDYINYHWAKPGTNAIAPKISFIKGVDEWQWMIGAGVYVDEIEENIDLEREVLYKRMFRKGIIGFLILIIVLLIIYYLSRKNSVIIQRNFSIFINKLTKAVKSGQKLSAADYSLADLKNIVPPINEIITDKAEVENRLSESELRFRTLFHNVPIMILVFDANFVNKYHNKAFEEVFNVASNQQVSSFTLRRRLPNTEANKIDFAKLMECNGGFHELELISAGRQFFHNWACFSMKNGEYILAGVDITALHEQQSRLKASNNTKDKVLSVISHDLHGPFSTIIGFAKILIESEFQLTDEKRLRYLQHIYNSSKSMHTMLTNLLSWARAQSGKIKLYLSHIDAYILVVEVIRTLTPLAEQKKIRLRNHIEHGQMLYTDPSILRIVVQNLIANGIKFTNEDGTLDIFSRQLTGNRIQIEVTDDGIGMAYEMVERINSGKKVESKKGTGNESGTGLGLLICHEFVTNLNGEMKVISAEGRGTTFLITLPAPPEAEFM
jgi:signal transduction histidine kinase